ncbi:MAG: glycosyltransferase [Candidatus Pacebacteria bacterium]|nr:glycosyltransferase [Candidatus Paceibacterota bacterium]
MLEGVSIIIPTYNEEKNIHKLIERIRLAFLNSGVNYELIFIDDNSADNTVLEINKCLKKSHLDGQVYLKNQKETKGKGHSLLIGFKRAKYDTACMIDADLQYPPEEILPMYKKLENADIIVANRKTREGRRRNFLSKIFTKLFGNILLGIKLNDIQAGLKVFKKQTIERMELNPSPWSFDTEFLFEAKNNNSKIIEHDIKFVRRKMGESKVTFFSSFELALFCLKLKLNSIASDKFLRNNFIFFCGSLVVAVFNYLYHPVLGRMMSVEEFGEVQTLISLLAQTGIIIGIFRMIALNIISNQKTKDENRETILMLYKLALCATIVISSAIIICSPFLKSFFHFNSFYPFISLAIILFIGFLISFREAILQGRHKFKALSLNQIFLSSGRLIFSALLVYLGWSSFGAISGIIIAQSIVLFYIISKTKLLFDFSGWNIKIDWQKMKRELKYGSLILTVSLCVTFLYTADIMIVKHYFPSETAGLYSGIAIIARIIFFVTGSIVGVLLPSIKLKDKNGNNRKILSRSLFLFFSIGGTVLILFSLFPEFVINLLLGDRYLVYAHLLPRMSLLLFLVSVINLLFFYLLALRNYSIAIIAILGISITIAISLFRHDTLVHIVNNFLFGTIVILGLLGMLFIKRMGCGVKK